MSWITANLKTVSSLNEIRDNFWFIAVNVVPKTQITQKTAQTAAHLSTVLVNNIREAIRNTTSELKENASVYPTAA